ncbi:MFS transporter [Microbacterium radiodurans]|uniref:MFS transporter n=2 Tax=Microbacterium radiodurans TaxID=661398 RepID=A0A5J5IY12_9MICO|nr:MFS transporter [Microbacterium radiodurans]
MRAFLQVLGNTLVANVTSSFLWFALTFWAYLETKNVLATSIIGGSYMLLVAVFGILFGALVDHMKKKAVMMLSSIITLSTYLGAGAVYLAFPESTLIDWGRPWFWAFAGLILVGGVVENLRNIALSTTVTLLVPGDRRDRANGLVGTVQGVAFMVTSVFSGLSVGLLGMGWTVIIAVVATAIALAHLVFVSIPEPRLVRAGDAAMPSFTFRGVLTTIRRVPGLLALIVFTTINNLVGGVFMALMDPYGLTLFSVEIWGVVLAVTGTGFIAGGAIVAARGLGRNPVRTLLMVNVGIAILGIVFALREWWWLYALGIFVFMMIMPIAEAAEQTVIQRVVPFETQGRVFGFAASVESAAAPVSAYLIGPVAQFWLIPFMQTDAGQRSLGWLLGPGEARGIALAFVVASSLLLVLVAVAFASPQYRRLSQAYADAPPPEPQAAGEDAAPDAAEPAPEAAVRSTTDAAVDSPLPGRIPPV